MPIRCLRVGLPRFGSVWSHPSLTGLSLLSRHPCKTRPVRPTIFVHPKCPVSRLSSNQVRLPLPVPFYRFGTCPAKNTKAPNLLRHPKSFWRDRFEATSTLLQILRLPFNVSGFSDVNGFSGYRTVSRRKFQSEGIDTIVAVARLTYESFYIVDYHRMNFLYISKNPFFLCAHSVKEVKQMGFEFYYRHIAEEELPDFIRVHQACFSFIREVKIPDRSNYVSSINLHLQRPGSQRELLIHLQETPLVLSENGNVWLTLCQVSLPASGRNDETRLFSSRADRSWGFNKFDGRFHEDHSRLILSGIERQILHFASRGRIVFKRDRCQALSVCRDCQKSQKGAFR